MTDNDKKRIYKELSAQFTDEAIERSEGRLTGKGYDTTGIKYQYIVNRLNEVIGLGGWRTEQKIAIREGTTQKGRTVFDATCDMTLQLGEWIEGAFKPWAEASSTGGHQSVNEADAKKGAATNGLKKCAAMFGCGKAAYEGTLDDDNLPAEHGDTPFPPPEQHQTQQRTPQARPEPVRQQVQDTRHTPPPEQEFRSDRQNSPPETQPQNGNGNARLRLSSKQLAAIWAIARKLGYQQPDFRKQVRSQYGVQPEFLDKHTASILIGQLSARAANGASHPAGEPSGAAA